MDKLRHYILIVCLCIGHTVFAWAPWPLPMDSADNQADSIIYGVELTAVTSSGTYAPFWLQTNRFGTISAQPHSGNLSGYIGKAATRPNRWFDYDFGVELIGRVDTKGGTGFFQQLYGHVRLYVFDITIGIKPETWGNQDPELSSGGFLFSQNIHPMPRITIGIDHYTAFPFTYGYMEVKGGITHGWFADNVYIQNAYLHHKFVGVRLGGKLPVNLNYEFHHAAQWGGTSPVYGALGSSFGDWKNVFLARSGGVMANDQLNVYGNHIGSQNLGVDVKGKGWKISAYWQNIFEDGPIKPIWHTMNLSDGVWGIAVRQSRWPFISGFLYEFIQTTDQSGPFHDRDGMVFGGADSYFCNGIYRNGWNYFYRTIGTPFITSPLYNDNGDIATLNNRVVAHHIGVQGDIYGFRYRALVSHADNYGRYQDGNDLLKSRNTALLLEVKKHVPQAWGLDFSIAIGADIGTQFGNDVGLMVTIAKRGLIWEY